MKMMRRYLFRVKSTPQRVIERALNRVERQGECIVSLYSVANHGYAQIGWHDENKKTQMRLVHRIAWESAHGIIPEGMTVDHICHNRRCVRIDHLRLLSNVDNGRRNAVGRDFPIGWVCKNNHPASSQVQVQRRRGLGWTCKECADQSRKKWAEAHPDRIKIAQARYAANHADRIKASQTAYNKKKRAKND